MEVTGNILKNGNWTLNHDNVLASLVLDAFEYTQNLAGSRCGVW
jgi:hypothetical protein